MDTLYKYTAYKYKYKRDTPLRMENKNFCLMYTYLNVLLNNKTTWTELDSHRLHYCL